MKQILLILFLSLMFLVSVLGILVLNINVAHAKNFGVQGHIQPIEEEDLLDLLFKKLNTLQRVGGLERLQKTLQAKTLERLKEPRPVLGLQKALKHRIHTHDPSLKVPFDIKDHEGVLIHAAGKSVNPLDYIPFNQVWIFIEGRDPAQVRWALERGREHRSQDLSFQIPSPQTQGRGACENTGDLHRVQEREGGIKHLQQKIILVNGAPFDLAQKYKERFYFDQLGHFTKKFTLKHVPSLLYQCGKKICIEEMPIDERVESTRENRGFIPKGRKLFEQGRDQ